MEREKFVRVTYDRFWTKVAADECFEFGITA